MKLRTSLVILASIIVVVILIRTTRTKSCGDCACGCGEGQCKCEGCDCEKCHKKWKVYGATWCGWTTRQLKYMKKNNKAYEFIDCEKEQCNGIKSFPTLVSSDGEHISGYREV